jgi:cephalosporin hydroxylase
VHALARSRHPPVENWLRFDLRVGWPRSGFVLNCTPGCDWQRATDHVGKELDMINGRLIEFKTQNWLIPARQIKRFLADLYPSMLLRLSRRKREALASEFRHCVTIKDCMDFASRHTVAGSIQIPWEIESAIKMIKEIQPRVMCEIGTLDGGTSLLFSKFLPTVQVMICIDVYVKNKQMLKLLAQTDQQLRFFDMSSYSERTIRKVSQFLNGRTIDALFIDGDHRYESVKQDFINYRSFVTEGGMIFFHDIVPDNGSNSAWAGGVPRLWRELATHYPHREFIQSQNGYGIGMLTFSRGIQPPL